MTHPAARKRVLGLAGWLLATFVTGAIGAIASFIMLPGESFEWDVLGESTLSIHPGDHALIFTPRVRYGGAGFSLVDEAWLYDGELFSVGGSVGYGWQPIERSGLIIEVSTMVSLSRGQAGPVTMIAGLAWTPPDE